MHYDLGQSLDGKDDNGKPAKLFGYFPVVRWDPRWSKKVPSHSFYSCRVVGKRFLLVKMPACNYGLLYGMGGFALQPADECMIGMNSGAVSYNDDPKKSSHEWKYVSIEYPEGTVLSAKALNGDAPEGVYLDIQYFAITCDGKTDTFCGWPVADLSKDTQKTGMVKDDIVVKSAEAIAREKMEALGI